MKRILKEEMAPEIGPEKSIDAQVLAFFVKADGSAIKDAETRDLLHQDDIGESLRRKNMKFLFEEVVEGDPDFNVETFASEVARLIENTEYLLDLKGCIIQMAESYIKNAHGEEASDSLTEVLESEYDLTKEVKQDEEANTNFAVGARTAPA